MDPRERMLNYLYEQRDIAEQEKSYYRWCYLDEVIYYLEYNAPDYISDSVLNDMEDYSETQGQVYAEGVYDVIQNLYEFLD